MKVLTVSRVFPGYHYRAGEPTEFIEKIKDGRKKHTIRGGNRWKAGDSISLRYWSEKPYRSKQVEFEVVEVVKTYRFDITKDGYLLEGKPCDLSMLTEIATNDGLTADDLELWFAPYAKKGDCQCQIICWNNNINYNQ